MVCRQRAAQSLLWCHNIGGTEATVGGGLSRGVALRMDISIIIMVCFADNASTCSLNRDSRVMRSARSTVAVVASRRRGGCRHGRERSIRVSHRSHAYSGKELMSLHVWRNGTYTIVFVECLAHNTATGYARWFVTAVPCRQRVAQSPLWS